MTRACRLAAVAAVAAAVGLTACDRTPDGVIPPDEMASLMADIHTAESVSDTERRVFSNDSMRRVLKQSVLARHGYNVADFDSSLIYYGKNIDEYAKLYEDIVKILEERISEAETQAATDGSSSSLAMTDIDMTVEGDSVDVWGLPRSVIFSQSSPVRIIPFGISSDRYWERGDIYTLRGKMSGATDAISMAIGVEYMDGSVDYMNMRSIGNGWKTATLTIDSAKVARYVFGTLSYPVSDASPMPPAAIDSISLYRSRYNPAIRRDPRTRSVAARR